MFESEDGYLTGSIDVSKLDQVEPKSDEAKAQVAQLKAEAKASAEQSAADAERLAKLHEAQSAEGQAKSRETVTTQAGRVGVPDAAEKATDQKAADQQAASSGEQADAGQEQAEDTYRPRSNASKDEWVTYAESQGMPRDEAQGKSKADLQAQYGG